MNYSGALSLLGSKDTYKLKPNTILEKDDDCITLRLHATPIIKFFPDGSIKIRNGGYQTRITQDRLYEYLDRAQISTRDGSWIINVNYQEYIFEDGMVIFEDGTCNATLYAIYEIDRNAEIKISTLEDVQKFLEGSTIKAIKALWRKCKFSRATIAYYAPLEFIPLIIPSASGDESWYSTASSRLANG
jgi:hypothetical protein